MKMKKAAALLLALAMSASLAACGNSNKSSTSTTAATASTASTSVAAEEEYDPDAYLSGINVADYVDLPKGYANLTIEVAKDEVTDEQVESAIQQNLDLDVTYEEVTDHDTVQDGDYVNIDYTGKIDGNEFDGGSAEGYDLEIGSGTFIDGFEDGLIGHKKGDTVDLNLKFPDDYSNSDVAGKDVVFTVTINKIEKEVKAELNDDYVKNMGLTDSFGNAITTVDAFRKYVRTSLEENAEQSYEQDCNAAILSALSEKIDLKKDAPEAMITRIYNSLNSTYTQYASNYGMSLSDFLQVYGYTDDTFKTLLNTQAQEEAKDLIILQAIAEDQELEPTDSEVSEGLTSDQSVSADEATTTQTETEREYLMYTNVMKYLRSKATVNEPASTSDTASEAVTTQVEEETEEQLESAENSTAAAAASTD